MDVEPGLFLATWFFTPFGDIAAAARPNKVGDVGPALFRLQELGNLVGKPLPTFQGPAFRSHGVAEERMDTVLDFARPSKNLTKSFLKLYELVVMYRLLTGCIFINIHISAYSKYFDSDNIYIFY